MPQETLSPRVLRALGALAVTVLSSIITGILFFSAGLFDPFPTSLEGSPLSPGIFPVSADAPVQSWVAEMPRDTAADVRLTANAVSTPAAFGLMFGSPDRSLTAAVSSEGYLAVWLADAGKESMLLPWQTWPHVRSGQAENEIRLARNGDAISLWINRERLWEGVVADLGGQIGILAQAPAGMVEVQFGSLVYAEQE